MGEDLSGNEAIEKGEYSTDKETSKNFTEKLCKVVNADTVCRAMLILCIVEDKDLIAEGLACDMPLLLLRYWKRNAHKYGSRNPSRY